MVLVWSQKIEINEMLIELIYEIFIAHIHDQKPNRSAHMQTHGRNMSAWHVSYRKFNIEYKKLIAQVY